MVVLGSIASNSVQSKHIYYKWLLIAETKVMDVFRAGASYRPVIVSEGLRQDRTEEEVRAGSVLPSAMEAGKHLKDS